MNRPQDAAGLFSVTFKTFNLAWRTNKTNFVILSALCSFLGIVVYLQFTSFSSIVDIIIGIRQKQNAISDLLRPALVLGLSYVIPTLISNFVNLLRAKFRLEMDLLLDIDRVDKQSQLDIATLESSHYQNLLQSAKEWGTSSILNVQDFIFSSATTFSSVITSMIILGSLSPWLVCFAIAAALPVYFFYNKYSIEVFRARYFSLADQRIIVNRTLHFEQLHKAIDVVLLKLGPWFRLQILERLTSYNAKIISAEKKKAMSYNFISLWYLLFLFAAIALMTEQTLSGALAIGDLLLAFTTYSRFYQTVNSYLESISMTEEAARYATKWFELFDLKPLIQSDPNAEALSTTEPPKIEFRNVYFKYPSENPERPFVLKNISFVIRPGEKFAIVGVNGAGKTSLVKLLCRVYEPTDGMILVDGVDLRKINLEHWHAVIGILFQDFPTYNLTIRESIGIGRIHTSMDQSKIEEAANFSGSDGFISSYDQLIWKEFKNGIDLSKGQHQRLAVARMFYRNAPITILDEPTASVDALTEEKIFASLEEHTDGKTIVLITHRFSTAKNADNIIVLEQGEIREQGSHLELMELNGTYARLYDMQLKRYTM